MTTNENSKVIAFSLEAGSINGFEITLSYEKTAE